MRSDFSCYRIIDLLESGASSFVYGEIKKFSSTYKPASGTIPAQKNDDVDYGDAYTSFPWSTA